jgi:hypothetical protein
MRLSHDPLKTRACFDDPNLVSRAGLVPVMSLAERAGFKSFLHHAAKDRPQARRTIALKVPKKVPRVVTAAEMQAILDACEHLRDRFLSPTGPDQASALPGASPDW